MKGEKHGQLDPLYVIFEQHLYNFQDDDLDRKTFIDQVLQDYLVHLRKLNISVPKSLEQPIVEELSEQIKVMLIKKIYGCLSIQDYQKRLPAHLKKVAKSRYSRLAKARRQS
jgi:hypothetical protein